MQSFDGSATELQRKLYARSFGVHIFSKLNIYLTRHEYIVSVTDKAQVTAKAEPMNEETFEIVDIADIAHTLAKRGREPYRNDSLQTALKSLPVGKAIKWVTIPAGLSVEERKAFTGKMRNRVKTLADAVEIVISVTWNNEDKCVIKRKK